MLIYWPCVPGRGLDIQVRLSMIWACRKYWVPMSVLVINRLTMYILHINSVCKNGPMKIQWNQMHGLNELFHVPNSPSRAKWPLRHRSFYEISHYLNFLLPTHSEMTSWGALSKWWSFTDRGGFMKLGRVNIFSAHFCLLSLWNETIPSTLQLHPPS